MKYYPIGTVVVLKEGTWPLMIYGGMTSDAEIEMERLLHIPENV